MNKFLVLILLLIIVTSCIPHKQLVYFQGEPVTKENVYKLNNGPYKLRVDDILNINIKCDNMELVSLFSQQIGNAQSDGSQQLYFTGYTIDRHGNIRLPYIGEINVLGFTEKEVREKLEYEIKKYINYSNSIFVTVKLEGIRFTTLGEINKTGTSIIQQNKLNIIEAISSSGDVSDTGDRSKITIIREELDGVKKYQIDITNINLFDSKVFNIKHNDIIYVPPLKRKSWGVGTTGFETFNTVSSIFTVLVTTLLVFKTF
jgi:polysaccharide export outer membrane protein